MLFKCRIIRCGKKKDEFVTNSDLETNNAQQTLPVVKFNAQPVITTSNKPVVGFNDLKIKSQFLLNETQQQTNTTTELQKTETVVEENTVDIDLTQTRVDECLKLYAEQKSKLGSKQLYATLSSSKITLVDKTIVLELNNETQKEMLTGIKQDVLDELRKLLQNKQAQLEINVALLQGEVKAYKPSDKFKQMAEKNPALLELKRRFDLDIEY